MNLKHNQRTPKGLITWSEMEQQTMKLKRSTNEELFYFSVVLLGNIYWWAHIKIAYLVKQLLLPFFYLDINKETPTSCQAPTTRSNIRDSLAGRKRIN